MRRVVITGIGVLSPLGSDLASTWSGLLAGRSGISALPVPADYPVRIGGVVPDFDPAASLGAKAARGLDRFAAMAVVAARNAVGQAGLGAGDSSGWATVVGSGLGGLSTYERAMDALDTDGRVSPYTATGTIANAAAAAVARDQGARGPSFCPVSACASGTDAIGLGADLIRLGRADVVLAGGADAPLNRGLLAGLSATGAASSRNDDPQGACRPFAEDRDGLVPGEGAAVLVLEAYDDALSRGATPLAEVAGYAATNDAFHLVAPRPDGEAARTAMRLAMLDAGVVPEEVGYVNAHGTATRRGDEVEASVIASAVGPTARVSSTKSMTGHLMGAAGAVEAAICVQVLQTGQLPATRNLENVDPACDKVDLLRKGTVHADVDVVVSNSFGFGGHNAVVVLRRI
ncbi:MAG: beta-ketoacyl-[acyl-carrier-protein] synthase family protein [Mycobacteriales bacterium]